MSLNNGKPHNTLLELSAKAQYALLALIELSGHSDPKNPLTINEISARQLIPERYLEQIFTLLRRGGVLQSQRGARGGYTLSKEPWQITVLEVITLVEGDHRNREIGESCSVEREMIYEIWQQANGAFQSTLSQHTLQDLCQRRDLRKQDSPMYYI